MNPTPPPPRPTSLAIHPVERLPTFVPRPIPGEIARGSLAAQVCNRTFVRDWVAGRASASLRRF